MGHPFDLAKEGWHQSVNLVFLHSTWSKCYAADEAELSRGLRCFDFWKSKIWAFLEMDSLEYPSAPIEMPAAVQVPPKGRGTWPCEQFLYNISQ
jgi:hypothetical protein